MPGIVAVVPLRLEILRKRIVAEGARPIDHKPGDPADGYCRPENKQIFFSGCAERYRLHASKNMYGKP